MIPIISTTEKYKSEKYSAEQEICGTLTLADGAEISLTSDDIVQNTLTLKESAVSGSQFGVGAFVANQLDIGLTLNIGNRALFTSAEIYLCALYTFEDKTTQKIDIGTFYVDDSTVQRTRNSVSFTAYDGAINFDKNIGKNLAFRKLTPYTFLCIACNACGMKLGTPINEIERMANGKRTFNWTEQEQTYTYRDMVTYILQILGAFGRINRSANELEVVSFSTTPDFEVTGDNAVSRTVSDTAVTVTGAKFGETSVGAEGFVIDFSGNPFLTSENDSTVKSILMSTVGFLSPIRFYTADITWFGDLSVQAGDCFTYEQDGLHGGTRKIIVMDSVWKSHGCCTLKSYGDTAAGAYSPISKIALAQAETLAYVKTNYVLSKVVETEYLKAAQADITFAKVTDLSAANANISSLTADTANIKNILAGNIGTGDLQTINLTAENATVSSQFAKDIIAKQISVGDLLAGTISTNKFTIVSDSGNVKLYDNTLLIKDGTRARVQIGKDGNGDYSMYVWDKSGNLMFDALNGLHESGIKSGIIRDEMVADNAHISGGKIDMESLFSAMNDSEYTISSSKVFYDDEGQTLQVAFGNLKTSVNTVKSELAEVKSNVTSQGTQLNILQGQISSKVWQSDIFTTVNAIEIGGRNLAHNTSDDWSDWQTPKDNAANVFHSAAYAYLPDNKAIGDTYTCSIEVEFNGVGAGTGGAFDFRTQGSVDDQWNVTNIWNSTLIRHTTPPTNGVYKYTSTVKITSANVNNKVFMLGFRADYWNGTGKYRYRKIKVEKGNKPTDWTPAPEDVDSDITALNDKTTTLTNQYSTLEQNLTSITATVAKHTTDISKKADNTTVSALSSNVTQLTADLSGFKSTVSSTYTTKTEFNNLEVGGRNLLTNSKSVRLWYCRYGNNMIHSVVRDGGTYIVSGQEIKNPYKASWKNGGTGDMRISRDPNTSSDALTTAQNMSLANKTYTFSVWVYADVACSITCFMARSDDSDDSNKNFSLTANTWTKISMSKKYSDREGIDGIRIRFKVFDVDVNTLFALAKLEEGNKSTDWTPAPEDIDSDITALEDRVATAETSITQNTSNIALRATKTEVTNAISTAASDATVKANNALASAKSYADAQITVSADSITNTVSKTYATKTTVNGIQSTMNTMQSSITQNVNNINLKVSKNNLVSEINQSAGTITLNSNRLVINSDNFKLTSNGTITATSATLKSATITGSLTTAVSDSSYLYIHGNQLEVFRDSKRLAYITPVVYSSTYYQLGIMASGNYDGITIGGAFDGGWQAYYRVNIQNAETNMGCRHWFSGDVKFVSGKFKSSVNFESDYGLQWNGNIGLRYISSGLYGAGLYLGIMANSCDTYLNSGGKTEIHSGGDTEIYAGSNKAIKLHSPTYVYNNLNVENAYIDIANNYGIRCGGNIAFRWYSNALYCGISSAPLKLVGSSVTSNGTTVSSDERLKNHIEPIDDRYLQLLDVLDGKKYFYNDYRKTTRNCGFTAQDLLKGMSAVGLTADEFGAFCDVYGNGSEYAIDYMQFVPILWEIVKKIKAEISAIKEEI